MNLEEFNRNIGRNIKRIRRSKEMNQSELAKELEISRSGMAIMETGRQNFLAHRLQEICDILDCKISELFEYRLK